MAGLDEAADAFGAAMGVKDAPKESGKESKPTERMFENLGQKSDDDDGPAGGDNDDELPPEVKEPPSDDEPPAEEEEEAEEGEEEEEEGKEEDTSDKYLVTVDGEQKEVSLKEALEGYIRTDTFQKRLSQLMEARQYIAKEAETLRSDRERYTNMLSDLQQQMELMIPQEPNWDELFQKNPAQARELQKQYHDFYTKKNAITAERERIQKEAEESNSKNLANYIRTEQQKFVNSDKRWSDPKVLNRDLDAMRNTALNHGFSEEEINSVYDSRMLLVLNKAAKYDKMMANKPVPVRKGKSSVRPGAGNTGTAQRGLAQAQKRLAKSGSIDDAAAVFKTILR